MSTESRNARPSPEPAVPPASSSGGAPPAELRNLPAPAKLNLFLHVTGRRADGYHLLETVFDLVELADRIDLAVRDDGQVLLADALPGVAPEQDLTVRAARLLAEHTGSRLGVTIGLTKVIPIGGGMGGGSSDAATVLLGLNRLWGLGLPAARLAELGVRLGADVPVFIGRQAAYATGIGDVLRPLKLPQRHYVIVAPPVQVPTAEVFRDPELTRDTKPLKIPGLSRGRRVFDGRNDLQPVVLRRFPPVALALRALTRAAAEAGITPDDARMTGSGACVFLPLEAENQARAVADRLNGRVPGRILVTRSLIDHPLRD